ncbi:mono-ADP-ribosyltransferase sirtuin 6 [Monoraphidium neglectum]|uniref:protein acetyllysine N-acetyltransferase n=1 Tax=Monoraphidium neglectum TaxID=145388 RepID=A0A0D2M8X9_9CHLO|nr:mono-ADP-ribosyltransferase sirtuin 6 [Monoraphidium neglectum]KIY99709.1 mono-ADP-ribosyltransferase sirtuin 6 [Monoraphidium neglectum]|eukprot:XP_013898729.1 mono-ADP-ribosyltransferase sirtuin 6 [Monoraphidium neglectum]
MSLGYADRLSFREDLGGRLGAPELFDDAARVADEVERLAEMVRCAERVVAFTGAGISTACGIPDFRGPGGVWTLQRAGKPPPRLQTSFVYAKPSLTHMALVALMQAGKLTYICSQNVDGLHLRSGVPRAQLAELHGNCFAERCRRCGAEYVRDFEMDTVGFKPSGRGCTRPGCRGKLHDHILDWEDALPDDELDETERRADEADLSICLGTSLQIVPAANLPLRTLKTGGQLAIINLQATPKDRRATLVVHARVDGVMALLLRRLGLGVPRYTRSDAVVVGHRAWKDRRAFEEAGGEEEDAQQQQQQQDLDQQQKPQQEHQQEKQLQEKQLQEQQQQEEQQQGKQQQQDGHSNGWGFTLTLSSVHGAECPLPMVRAAEVAFPGTPGLRPARLEGGAPLTVRRWVGGGEGRGVVVARVRLLLVDAADEDKRVVEFDYTLTPARTAVPQTITFETQRHDYSDQQQRLCGELEASAAAARAAAAAGAGGGGVGRGGGARAKGRPRAAGSGAGARYEEREVEGREVEEELEDGGGGGAAAGDGAGRGTGAGAGGTGRARKKARRLNL